MVSLNALILLAAVSAPPDTVLLDFSADWCGHCKTMQPTMGRLEADGYSVQHVNVDRQRPLATQFGVAGVPTYVLVVDGREVGRLEGATSYDRLVQLYRAAKTPTANKIPPAAPATPSAAVVRGQSPEQKPIGLPALDKLGSMFDRPARDNGATPAAGAASNPLQRAGDPGSLSQAAIRATVRLRVDDPKGQSIGTGTIIDTHDDEALIVTCGHIFRDSQGKGGISVELFVPGAGKAVAGQLVDYDLERDIGLVSFRPGLPVQPMKVAPAGLAVARGHQVFSVGCDRGGPPSAIESRVTAVNKYLGPPNIEVAGQPVDGRSGGGLFSSDGHLIGICNAADPADKEGIYAALATVQWQLDRIGLQHVYQPAATTEAVASDTPSATVATVAAAEPVANFPRMNTAPPVTNVALRDQPRSSETSSGENIAESQATLADDAELICIIRPRGNPAGRSEVLYLDRAPRELLERLSREARPNRGVDANRTGAKSPLSQRSPLDRGPSERGQVIRGQSSE